MAIVRAAVFIKPAAGFSTGIGIGSLYLFLVLG
jgi:hypothetical protein